MDAVSGIRVTDEIILSEQEIEYSFIRASGPGGQNVNKVSTAVQLRFDVRNSPSLSEDIKERLSRIAGRQLNDAGILVIESRSFRTQSQNRQEAMDRLILLIRKAAVKPVLRKKTRPSEVSIRRRLEKKRRHGDVKRLRGPVSE